MAQQEFPTRFQVIHSYPGSKAENNNPVFDSPEKAVSFLKSEWNSWLNSGFPFAKVVFDSLSYRESALIYARILPGPFVENGQLVLHGDSSFRVSMLRRWFRFQKGQPFAWNRFIKIRSLTDRLLFAKESNAPELEWFGDKAILHVFLEKKGSNSFSGILGLLPASGTNPPILTGNLDASLNNLFGIGAGLSVKWTRFAPSSQTADIQFKLPALNYHGLGLEGQVDFFRQDSLYTRQKFEFMAIQTTLSGWDFLVGFSAFGSSGRFGNSNDVQSQTNVRGQGIQLGLRFIPDPDFVLIPGRRKAVLQITPTAKSISRSSGKLTIPHLTANASGAWPLAKHRNKYYLNSTWKIGGVFSKEITLPDLARIGGVKDFRGFYENEFFASRYAIIGIQPQVWVDNSLLIGLLSDFGVMDLSTNQPNWTNLKWAMSLGFSIEFESGANLIRLSLANGQLGALPANLQATKVHFGYLARF